MTKKRLGKTNLMVTPVAMGGIPITRLSKNEAADVVRKVLDMGVNFIDTANVYLDSEEKIGKALRGRK
ncbi:MAG: aldo/keto reductase, partial [Firmicutes bacterium]|nr:aldo/keto reductase [Bacillota bacterium]